jgi:putative spermidine/putrescine transport system ATP-binding protein
VAAGLSGKQAAMGTAAIKLRAQGIAKHYGAVQALAPTELDIEAGEFVTLLGPSGSGKTTLLMIIAGLVEPDQGEVWIDGKPAGHTPPFRRDIGMVFQSYALFPHLAVFENIAFPLRMRRCSEEEIAEAVKHALEMVRLPGMAHRFPRELSGGQQQRVALARALVDRPSIILMDEPLGALDKKLREEMQLEIKELHTELGITVLYVTHDQEEALAMSDRICLMNHGTIAQIGTPTELYFAPTSVFAANFLGDSNILAARVTDPGPPPTLTLAAGESIRARGTEGMAKDTLIHLLVRPECLRLLTEGEAETNHLRGELDDVVMLGDVTRYLVRLADGTRVSAKRLTAAASPPPKGSPVTLGWSAEDTVVLSS